MRITGKVSPWSGLDAGTEAAAVFDEIILISDREMRKHPEEARYNADLWTNRGRAFAELQRYTEALDAYNEAIGIDPKHTTAIEGRNAVVGYLAALQRANQTVPPPIPVTRSERTRSRPWRHSPLQPLHRQSWWPGSSSPVGIASTPERSLGVFNSSQGCRRPPVPTSDTCQEEAYFPAKWVMAGLRVLQ